MRFFDFCIALVALIVLSPVLLVISVCLFIANGKGSPSLERGVWGRLLFFQERPGKDEKIFKVIKFKTMTDERDAEGNLLPDAQRLTKVGRFVISAIRVRNTILKPAASGQRSSLIKISASRSMWTSMKVS